MDFALVARADNGGLGTITWEAARALRPTQTLIVDVRPRRGGFHPERFDGSVQVARYPLRTDRARAWLDGLPVLTVETFYGLPLRGMLLAMPELLTPTDRYAAGVGDVRLAVPTEWEQPFQSVVLPVPVAHDRIPFRRRTEARTFLHLSSPAMADRQGTRLVRDAVRLYDGPPITVLIAGPERPDQQTTVGNVTVLPVPDVRDYYDRWTDDIDMLIQPRRYGGLSLPVQEAAAAGIPTLCLDRQPERSWPGCLTIPVSGQIIVRMKGGEFPVDDADPACLAGAMHGLATGPLDGLSQAAYDWTLPWTWDTWRAWIDQAAVTGSRS